MGKHAVEYGPLQPFAEHVRIIGRLKGRTASADLNDPAIEHEHGIYAIHRRHVDTDTQRTDQPFSCRYGRYGLS